MYIHLGIEFDFRVLEFPDSLQEFIRNSRKIVNCPEFLVTGNPAHERYEIRYLSGHSFPQRCKEVFGVPGFDETLGFKAPDFWYQCL